MRNLLIYALLMMALAAGCASPQSRYYHLSAAEAPCPECTVAGITTAIVSIGPVIIPDRLDRSQIVTVMPDGELNIAQFDRWGGSLNEEIVTAITKNVSALLPALNVIPFEMEKWVTPDYQARIDILELNATPGKEVSLRASYTITDKNRKTLLLKSAVISEPCGSSYTDIVKASSKAVGILSSQIAGGLAQAISQTSGKK